MTLIFHQNMRAFGGDAAVRTQALVDVLDDVSTTTGATYAAAGFTDIRSAGSGLRGTLESVALTLDPSLRDLVIVEVGATAGSRRECAAIAWSKDRVRVERVGHVRSSPRNARGIPVAAGFVFIAGVRVATGARCLIGFTHNLFALGPPTRAFSHLGWMANAAAEAVGHPDAEVTLGGDLGLSSRTLNARGAVRLLPSGARVAPGSSHVVTPVESPRGFWLVRNAAVGDAQAAVYPDARVAHGADHASITLVR